MPITIEFTEDQRELIETPGSMFVEACPGAGKTQSIVERFLIRPNSVDRRGVALLSFTNTAASEARSRCAARPDLLETPNFVGTIDGFVNRFIVGPLYRRDYGRWPTFKDSWDTVQGANFGIREAQRITFHLDWFEFDHNGNPRLDPSRVRGPERDLVKDLKRWQTSAAEMKAHQLYTRFSENGIMDSEGARRRMWKLIDDPVIGGELSLLLGNRFVEAIVDEVQDCSPEDIRLIEFLLDSGIKVVMVGDLEQAIFGFRGSAIEAVRQLCERVPHGLRLSKNFRSSPSICALVDSLRYGTERDEPAGPWRSEESPICLVRYKNLGKAHAKVIEEVSKNNLDASQVTVLSHGRYHARKCAGAPAVGKPSVAPLILLARAVVGIRDRRSSDRERARAGEIFLSTLKSMANEELHFLADQEFCAAIGIDEQTLRIGCARLAYRLNPLNVLPSVFKEEVRSGIAALGWDGWIDVSKLRLPSGNKWTDTDAVEDGALRWSSIHSFKGLQSPAVALVIPQSSREYDSGVAFWEKNEPHEARRVLYVGASRAERLIVLFVHDSQCDAVVACLERDAVPFTHDTI